MASLRTKPVFNVDQLVSNTEAAKKFGELRKKAKLLPQYITDNGNVDTVLLSYELYEALYQRLAEVEQNHTGPSVLDRLEGLTGAVPSSAGKKRVSIADL